MVDKALNLFKEEFWKDNRKISLCKNNELIQKYYNNIFEMNTEISVLNFLKSNGYFNVPRIISSANNYTIMNYCKGIRIFNLLVEVDKYSVYNENKAYEIKKTIMDICSCQQSKLQKALLLWKDNYEKITPYPYSKLATSINILSLCLNIKYDKRTMNHELQKIYEYFINEATVPFRDSTTKNMILSCDDLHLSNFKTEKERNEFIFQLFENDEIFQYISRYPIIDFDFSTCINCTTLEDDYISLFYHERTWDGKEPDIKSLSWSNNINLYRSAITFIIRFLRFGSRKVAYMILHNKTYNIRFRYDNPEYYFKSLPDFLYVLQPSIFNEYPNIIKFVNDVEKKLSTIHVTEDIFINNGLGKKEKAYSDVFPY